MPQRPRLTIGDGEIVRAKRIGGDRIAPSARIAAGHVFQFEQLKVIEARFGQHPTRSQPGNAPACDQDIGVFINSGRWKATVS